MLSFSHLHLSFAKIGLNLHYPSAYSFSDCLLFGYSSDMGGVFSPLLPINLFCLCFCLCAGDAIFVCCCCKTELQEKVQRIGVGAIPPDVDQHSNCSLIKL